MPEDRDRFTIEYEIRHSFQTIAIGQPLKLTVIITAPDVDNVPVVPNIASLKVQISNPSIKSQSDQE